METELSSGKVTVTGSMDANKLVEYVYRRTKKEAKVVPQLPPEAEKAKESETKPQEQEEAGKDNEEAKPEEKKEEATAEAEKKDGGISAAARGDESAEKIVKEDGEQGKAQDKEEGGGENHEDGQGIQKMMMYRYYHQEYEQQPVVYAIERIPPPQLFSDENPNACCIT